MIGLNWQRPNMSAEMKARAFCCHDNELETMEHILLRCITPGQKELWALTKELWRKKYPAWIEPTLGTIFGCATAEFKDEEGKPKANQARLCKILISETTHLIWSLRCERIIKRNNAE